MIDTNDTLPSSLLQDKLRGCKMAEWTQPDGSIIRVEMLQLFCFGCGKPIGWAPNVMSYVSCLCRSCSLSKWGEYANQLMTPDQKFWDAVAEEMKTRFGRALTHEELCQLGEQGKLGTSLQILERESPYRNLLPNQ